ncbi:hypothetical protein PP707_07450 [Acetobacter pasteurianus]|nr:hypothetical protein [Acetobacter pasteurianus]
MTKKKAAYNHGNDDCHYHHHHHHHHHRHHQHLIKQFLCSFNVVCITKFELYCNTISKATLISNSRFISLGIHQSNHSLQ